METHAEPGSVSMVAGLGTPCVCVGGGGRDSDKSRGACVITTYNYQVGSKISLSWIAAVILVNLCTISSLAELMCVIYKL